MDGGFPRGEVNVWRVCYHEAWLTRYGVVGGDVLDVVVEWGGRYGVTIFVVGGCLHRGVGGSGWGVLEMSVWVGIAVGEFEFDAGFLAWRGGLGVGGSGCTGRLGLVDGAHVFC